MTLANRCKSVPISLIAFSAVLVSIPGMRVRSTPLASNSAARALKRGVILRRRAAFGRTQTGVGQRVDLERAQQTLKLAVALRDLAGVGVIQRQGLLQGEQMLRAPVARERGGNLGLVGLDAPVAQPRQCVRVTLARGDGAHDGLAGHAHEVGDDVVQLHVHLGQRLLYVLHMPRLVGEQHVAVAPHGAQRADLVGRAEGPA